MASAPSDHASGDDGATNGGADAAADARFEDAYEPARLAARDADDLKVLSALLQDAVLLARDVVWLRQERRFAFVADRYRWEEPAARERVRVGVHFDGVLRVRARGVPEPSADGPPQPLAILAATFEAAEEPPGGVVRLACAGGAEFEVSVDALDALLKDLGTPRKAVATPEHPE